MVTLKAYHVRVRTWRTKIYRKNIQKMLDEEGKSSKDALLERRRPY